MLIQTVILSFGEGFSGFSFLCIFRGFFDETFQLADCRVGILTGFQTGNGKVAGCSSTENVSCSATAPDILHVLFVLPAIPAHEPTGYSFLHLYIFNDIFFIIINFHASSIFYGCQKYSSRTQDITIILKRILHYLKNLVRVKNP